MRSFRDLARRGRRRWVVGPTLESAGRYPRCPRGNTSVTRTKRPPRTKSQASGTEPVSQVLARLTTAAPIIAPTSVPRPPTATQIAISIELAGENSLGLMMPTCGT